MLMTIDRQARTTAPGFVPDSLDPRDQSGALHDALHQPRDLKESLAASDDVVSRRYTPLPGREKKRSR